MITRFYSSSGLPNVELDTHPLDDTTLGLSKYQFTVLVGPLVAATSGSSNDPFSVASMLWWRRLAYLLGY